MCKISKGRFILCSRSKHIVFLSAELEALHDRDIHFKPLTWRRVYSNLCSRLQELSNLIKTTEGFILGEHEPHSMAEKRLQSGQIVNLFGGIEVRI